MNVRHPKSKIKIIIAGTKKNRAKFIRGFLRSNQLEDDAFDDEANFANSSFFYPIKINKTDDDLLSDTTDEKLKDRMLEIIQVNDETLDNFKENETITQNAHALIYIVDGADDILFDTLKKLFFERSHGTLDCTDMYIANLNHFNNDDEVLAVTQDDNPPFQEVEIKQDAQYIEFSDKLINHIESKREYRQQKEILKTKTQQLLKEEEKIDSTNGVVVTLAGASAGAGGGALMGYGLSLMLAPLLPGFSFILIPIFAVFGAGIGALNAYITHQKLVDQNKYQPLPRNESEILAQIEAKNTYRWVREPKPANQEQSLTHSSAKNNKMDEPSKKLRPKFCYKDLPKIPEGYFASNQLLLSKKTSLSTCLSHSDKENTSLIPRFGKTRNK